MICRGYGEFYGCRFLLYFLGTYHSQNILLLQCYKLLNARVLIMYILQVHVYIFFIRVFFQVVFVSIIIYILLSPAFSENCGGRRITLGLCFCVSGVIQKKRRLSNVRPTPRVCWEPQCACQIHIGQIYPKLSKNEGSSKIIVVTTVAFSNTAFFCKHDTFVNI